VFVKLIEFVVSCSVVVIKEMCFSSKICELWS